MKLGQAETLERIAAAINERKGGDPEKSYVAKLFAKGDDAMLKKIGEEATEVVLAAKTGERLQLVREITDLWFHCMIVLARHGLGPADVLAELQPETDLAMVGYPVTDEFSHQFLGLITPTDLDGRPNPFFDNVDGEGPRDGRVGVRTRYIRSAYAEADSKLGLTRRFMPSYTKRVALLRASVTVTRLPFASWS